MNYLPITIVTPVFNGEAFLEKTIKSVLDQNYPNLEYIICDGASSDNSINIIRKYDKQLSLWYSEDDKNMYDGLNKGFEQSSGEIMGWINADDILLPNSLFIINLIFQQLFDLQWVSGLKSTIDSNGYVVSSVVPDKYNRKNFLRGRSTIQQESTFWRRELWKQAGGYLDDDLCYAGDVDLWARFFMFSQIQRVAIPLGAFRRHSEGQLSQKFREQYQIELIKIRKKYRNFIKFYSIKNFVGQLLMIYFDKGRWIPEIVFSHAVGKFII